MEPERGPPGLLNLADLAEALHLWDQGFLQADGVAAELNYRTPTWCHRAALWCGAGTYGNH